MQAFLYSNHAVQLDAMAVPDFVAGLIYGFTGDWKLDEIEACYQGGSGVVDEAKTALDDIKAGKYIAGIKQIRTIVADSQTALSTCENLGDDMAKIDEWLNTYKSPSKLIKTASKNYLLHKRKIKSDISQVETDWQTKDYFDSGKDTATTIDLILPFPKSEELEVEGAIVGVPEFLAGFVYGMVGENHLSEFQTCIQSADKEAPYIHKFVEDLEQLHIISAFENLESFIYHLQMDVAPCQGKNLQDDITAIKAWAEMFKEPTSLVEKLGKHWLLHQKAIKKDISTEKSDWAAKNYFKAGADIADAVTLALGPIEKEFVHILQ